MAPALRPVAEATDCTPLAPMKWDAERTIPSTLPLVISKINGEVPLSNVPRSNIRGMDRDDTWRSTVGTWDRLKWARRRMYATAKDAAGAMAIDEGTYRAYERQPNSSKHIPLNHLHARHFAKRLGVRWEWLLLGEGEPWRDNDERRERILDAYDGASEDRKSAVADAIERLLKAG